MSLAALEDDLLQLFVGGAIDGRPRRIRLGQVSAGRLHEFFALGPFALLALASLQPAAVQEQAGQLRPRRGRQRVRGMAGKKRLQCLLGKMVMLVPLALDRLPGGVDMRDRQFVVNGLGEVRGQGRVGARCCK